MPRPSLKGRVTYQIGVHTIYRIAFRVCTKRLSVACEQALLFGRVKGVSRKRASGEAARDRGKAPRSRVLERLISLAQIGELTPRLGYLV